VSVGFSRPQRPVALPEHVLWTLQRAGRVVESRTRMTPLGPELRVYVSSRETGELELLWSQVPRDGREVGELADQERKDHERRGYR
jgi:hypothetical protein